jgi:2'-5' RNA ligase
MRWISSATPWQVSKMPRAFLAIDLPMAVRATLEECRASIIDADPSWRGEKWVAPENLHITLRFLGSLHETACADVAARVAEAVAPVEPYRMRLDVVRAVPRLRAATMVWVGASTGIDETAGLAEAVARATSFLDFEPQGRAFKTHVTLSRARQTRRLAPSAIDEVERLLKRASERAVTVSVHEVTLYGSTLTPRGPVYDHLATMPLGI